MIHGKKIRCIVNDMCKQGVLRVHAVDQAMKIVREKGAEVCCERCSKETKVTTGSFFDTKIVCLDCRSLEEKHPKYAEAKGVELFHVSKGNYNYEGIGLPEDWPIFAMAYSLGGIFSNGEYVFSSGDRFEEFSKYLANNGKSTTAGSNELSLMVK